MERDEHIAKWVSLTAKKVSDNLSETDRRKGGRPGAAAAASRELNISERDVQRAVKVASLTDEAKATAKEVAALIRSPGPARSR